MTPRILLLQEDRAHGGVRTVSSTLCQALLHGGWSIRELALSQCGWQERLNAARQCDVILAGHNFRPAYLAWAIGLLLRKPILVWVHGPLQEVLAQAHASPLKRFWLRWFYRRVPYFVFVSRTSQDSFMRFMRRPLTAHQHSFVIANAVPQTEAVQTPGSKLAAAADTQLAYIGRLSPEKQPSMLLDTLRLLPHHFYLTMVGDGPLRDELRQSGAGLLADKRLTIAGPRPHGVALYAPWHMTLLASRYEGCPMTMLESFAAGVPCVGLPISALQEVVGDDAPYLLARDYSAQALADAVQEVLSMPQHQLQKDMRRVLLRHQVKDFGLHWKIALKQAARRC